MATEVLRPQDLLVERLRVHPTHCRRDFPANGNLTSLVVNRKQHRRASLKPDKRKFNAAAVETKKSSHGAVADPRRRADVTNGGIVMGQVTLLRRGESMGSLVPKITDGGAETPNRNPDNGLAVLGGTVRIGPDSPVMVPKQIRLVAPPPSDIYAGSAFFSSPSPRSLPLPSFFNKKDTNDCKSTPFEDGATRDLRRLLRLE